MRKCILSTVIAITVLALSAASSSFASETRSTEVSVGIAPALSITTDIVNGTLSIPLNPTASGAEASGLVNINVATNNRTGYTLTMSSSTNDVALKHVTQSTASIPSTTAPLATPAPLTTNTWGYNNWTNTQIVNNTPPTTGYSRIPGTTADTLRTTTAPAQTSPTRLTFGARADTTIPAGSYLHTVIFTAVTNYVEPPQPVISHGAMQNLTNATCPTTRGTVYDIRNNQVYYVQKIPNSGSNPTTGALMDLCWMETNLKYSGGGTWDSTAGYPDDRKALAQRTTGTSDNTTAEYMDPGGSSDYTTPGPGTATVPAFYGYLYNWCAAMGGQTNACNTTSTTGFDTAISICPAGWRLPGGGATATTPGNDFGALNTAINGGSTTSDQGLRDNWLGVYSGHYAGGLSNQGSRGNYWSNTVNTAANSRNINFTSSIVYPGTDNNNKRNSFAVRCVI